MNAGLVVLVIFCSWLDMVNDAEMKDYSSGARKVFMRWMMLVVIVDLSYSASDG